ncbi:hypothetical protein [Paraburkholderia sp.]|uniref:hypothetical protein n=1 Tax=Paraburkholderia sp. TaxID=1926495 RepID=UPI003C7AE7D8
MTTFGWSWEYVDEQMTLPRLHAVWKQWKRFPPIHKMVAVYLGMGKPDDEVPQNVPLDGMFRQLAGETI